MNAAADYLTALALAPLLPGLISRVKAFFAGRQGQPVLQLYYDLWKLAHKGTVYSSVTGRVFRLGPAVSLAAVSVALALIPAGGHGALLAFDGDLILFAYLLALARFVTVLAALDTGSSFEGMGASREVFFSALAEPALFVSLAVMAKKAGAFSLNLIFTTNNPVTGNPLLLVAGALFIILLAENCRIPFDDPNTHLELTMIHEVMVLDHSGPDFGLISYGAALKLWLFSALIVRLVLPFGESWHSADNPALFYCGICAVALGAGLVESCMARFKLLKVPAMLLAAAVLAFAAFMVA
ncbi:MAG: NADH-quinone oxidoreductase subunit H [Elusimicrobiaceae bacterium]|nr:NADH-quinone oxidoreductase subunit H [Elusimicrobiaceae bacterium]